MLFRPRYQVLIAKGSNEFFFHLYVLRLRGHNNREKCNRESIAGQIHIKPENYFLQCLNSWFRVAVKNIIDKEQFKKFITTYSQFKNH